MHKSLLVGLLGLGRHRLRAGSCSRSLYQSSSASPCQTTSHAAAAPAAGAAATAPKQLPGPPHGRRYLPAAVGAQLAPQLLPAAAASMTGLQQQQGCVSITVQCSPNTAGTQILVRCWLFGTVCAQLVLRCSEGAANLQAQVPEHRTGLKNSIAAKHPSVQAHCAHHKWIALRDMQITMCHSAAMQSCWTVSAMVVTSFTRHLSYAPAMHSKGPSLHTCRNCRHHWHVCICAVGHQWCCQQQSSSADQHGACSCSRHLAHPAHMAVWLCLRQRSSKCDGLQLPQPSTCSSRRCCQPAQPGSLLSPCTSCWGSQQQQQQQQQ
jgi:hypothetical protein